MRQKSMGSARPRSNAAKEGAPAFLAAVRLLTALLLPALVVSAVALRPVWAFAASAADHEMEMKARESFAAGRFDEALQTFAKLYAETLHPVYLRNIGRCHQKLREPQKAIDSFRDYLAKAKNVAPQEQAEIEGYISEMQALQAAQTQPGVGAVGTASAPSSDHPPGPPSLVPGPVAQVEAPATSPPPGATLGPAPPGEGTPAASAPFYSRWWFWTAAGAVVAGGIVAAVALSSGSSRPPCPAAAVCM
jgi:tetratricopeptide (TPR) repeat protein